MIFEELENTLSKLPNYRGYGIYRANPSWIDIKVYRFRKKTFYGKGRTIEEALTHLMKNAEEEREKENSNRVL